MGALIITLEEFSISIGITIRVTSIEEEIYNILINLELS